ncbi:MAG TPA: hypothetical protein VGN18_00390 [Jatrophihabitans sp.]|jgi:hypothetical protein|uniref:hypothetical protein n=1 Tax=Jatrophihabitans sp. TaxID=1932789 RepID=UPI002E02D5AE|nr:hypothetical protein [Jatrophihabitans sp.]
MPRTPLTPLPELTIRALGPDTWPAFAALVDRNNGVWGGCWCTWFHCETNGERQLVRGDTYESHRDFKKQRVEAGTAHAALVFDGETAVGWCEYGPPDELPGIKYRKEYLTTTDVRPDYRITCFFMDKDYRRRGASAIALDGALDLIAAAGGGVVESYPQDTRGQKTSASFLYNGTRSLFEQAGFAFVRSLGAKHTVMTKSVAPAAG